MKNLGRNDKLAARDAATKTYANDADRKQVRCAATERQEQKGRRGTDRRRQRGGGRGRSRKGRQGTAHWFLLAGHG